MKLGIFTKAPVERKRYSLDYSDWLDTGETIAQRVFSVSPSTNLNSLTIDASLISGDGKSLSFFASLGEDDITYTVDVQITTSAGQVKEDQVFFAVKDA